MTIPALFDGYNNAHAFLEQNWDANFGPYYREHANMLAIWDSLGGYEIPKYQFQPDIEAFAGNRTFSNMMTTRMRFLANFTRETTWLKTELEDINEEVLTFTK